MTASYFNRPTVIWIVGPSMPYSIRSDERTLVVKSTLLGNAVEGFVLHHRPLLKWAFSFEEVDFDRHSTWAAVKANLVTDIGFDSVCLPGLVKDGERSRISSSIQADKDGLLHSIFLLNWVSLYLWSGLAYQLLKTRVETKLSQIRVPIQPA